ncbi:DUF6668 family protein [Streptosporangium lutulentum]|uniref:Uncharacterized protein n=1 Tax=Streptosporangium lutulentum TaxID=1461250 RepID=A0ABT9QVP0_9ACTN|nr:DUF6668 family protein [Streptosporangium lutulentum]MDP9850505.1 hypothetical protein [Streptosporangium lutulentum]
MDASATRTARPLESGRMLRPRHPVAPQPGAFTGGPQHGLPIRALTPAMSASWWWVGTHGGAGVSTLAVAVPEGAEHGRYWPAPAPASRQRVRVVIVARTNLAGLVSAQAAAAQWASGALPAGIDLLGLALVADAPGRLPRPLTQLIGVLAGGVPCVWTLPWVERLRTCPPHEVSLPRPYRSLAGQLSRFLSKG